MDPLRTASLWLGVGAGHAVALVALWGSTGGGTSPSAEDAGLLTVALLAPEAPASSEPAPAPVVASAGTVAPAVAARVSTKARPTAASVERAGPVSAAVGAVAGEPPGFLDRAEPLYPRGARLAGVEGVVRLRLEVAADGTLRRVERVASSGDAALDRAAEAAARASTYRPARVGGRSVDAEVEASYRFELR